MSRAKDLLESMYGEQPASPQSQTKGGAKREQTLTQYSFNGNVSKSSTKTKGTLESGIYDIRMSLAGPFFELHEVKTDALLRFEDKRYKAVLEEVSKFRKIRDNFKKMGYTHKRGLCLYGPPGTGKSCLVKLVMEDFVNDGNIVFICRDPSTLVSGLKEFREIEPERMALVVLEDADEMLRYNEHALLELFDGDNQMDGFLYLATTNYLERFPPRMLRAGRFDRKLKIDYPPYEGRLAYLKQKLAVNEKELRIEEIAKRTEGFSFGQLRELIISTYCLEYSLDDSIKRIRDNIEESAHTKYTEADVKRAIIERKDFFKNNMCESRARRVLEQLPAFQQVNPQSIKDALNKKLGTFSEFEGISVDEVDYDLDGNIFVTFVDLEDNALEVIFSHDEGGEGSIAIISNGDEEDGDVNIIDFDGMQPALVDAGHVKYLNLVELSWLTKSGLTALFQAGDIDTADAEPAVVGYDAIGNPQAESVQIDELTKTVIRGGKKVRLPIMRRQRKSRMKAGQKLAIARSARKAARKPGTQRKRARSLAIRKKAKLKKGPGLARGFRSA